MTDELMDELIGEYIDETQQRLDRIGDLLLELEREREPDVSAVKRELHTLKGNSAAFGLSDVSELCHIIEDYFSAAQGAGFAIDFQTAFDACDFFAAHTAALAKGVRPPVVSDAIRNAFLARGRESHQPVETDSRTSVALIPQKDATTVAASTADAPAATPEFVTAPVSDSDLEAEAVTTNESAAETPRRFLIVDDIRDIRALLVAILGDFGECVEAEDGLAAIAAFESSLRNNAPFSAVLLDIWMPRLDGHATLERIRSIEHQHRVYGSAGVKVIMVTAEERERHAIRAFKTGCQSYVVKPFRPTEIRRQLARLGALGGEPSFKRFPYRFRDDVLQVGIRAKNGSYQLAEVIDESRNDIRLYAEDVSSLRPETEVSVDYMDAPMPAVVRAIDPQTEDHRYPVNLEWV